MSMISATLTTKYIGLSNHSQKYVIVTYLFAFYVTFILGFGSFDIGKQRVNQKDKTINK